MRHSSTILAVATLLRPKQWIKNSFVVAPLLFTGRFIDPESIQLVCWATLYFCLASSAVYILNDIVDVERDKQHPTKSQKRPIANGTISTNLALAIMATLYVIVATASLINPLLFGVILAYILLNICYTYKLKHEPVLDIFSIATGFVLRVYAGALVLHVPVSSWMFITTLSLALYLAAMKRRQELTIQGEKSREVLQKYSIALIDRYAIISATGALVFYSLFVMESRPELTATIPAVLYGLFRYWYITDMLALGESPTDVLLSDWQLALTVAIWALLCGLALIPS
jgi:decaprenyl-phosphate phosphoribosyltransferase